MNRCRTAAAVLALGLAGATPLAASASGSLPANKQYDNPLTQTTGGGDVAGKGKTSKAVVAPVTVNGNNLPFTGFDAGLALAGGLTLVGLGLGLRRFSRRSDH